MLFSRLCNMSLTYSDWSFEIVIFRFSGKILELFASVRIFKILSVADNKFSPPFLITCKETTGCLSNLAIVKGSSYPSIICATSLR